MDLLKIFFSILLFYNIKICLSKCSTDDCLWPQPQYALKFEGLNFLAESKFDMSSNLPDGKIVSKTMERYKALIFNHPVKLRKQVERQMEDTMNPILSTLCIYVKGYCEEWPYLGMDEVYHLQVNTINNPNCIHLESPSVWGIIRGLETFSQLVFLTDKDKFAVRSQCITDFPRFGHRGLLIDTSLHYIPMTTILEALDAMSYNKMNVFNWHIVDDNSFPYQSVNYFPCMSQCGAYKLSTHIYTPSDVSTIVPHLQRIVVVRFKH